MSELRANLDSIAEHIRSSLSAKDAAREKALPMCREIIRHSSQAIRAVHRHEFDQARESLKAARDRLKEAAQTITEGLELSSTGFLRDAQKEFAEGNITLALVLGELPPTPEELSANYGATSWTA